MGTLLSFLLELSYLLLLIYSSVFLLCLPFLILAQLFLTFKKRKDS